ncbi:hypothetical protein AAC387_Pa03g1639 [Persea americana]
MQTLMHTLRMALTYLVMLELMSFNGGICIVAVAGHLGSCSSEAGYLSRQTRLQ